MRLLPGSLPAALVGKVLAVGAGLLLAGASGAGMRPASLPSPVAEPAGSGVRSSRAVAGGDPSDGLAGTAHVQAGALFSQRLTTGAVPDRIVEYQAPVPLPLQVVRGFDPPSTPFGPGHLGVDLAVAAHTLIRSAGPGLVSFAGPVAGRGVVVVSHPDGVRTEYEPVRPLVRRGDLVHAGTALGQLVGQHPGCPVTACLHWGARRGAAYIDPLGLLAPLEPVRLLPWDP